MSTDEGNPKKAKKPYFRTLKEYSSSSTTHGISYVFEDDRLIIERILWIVVVIIAIYIASSLSITAYVNWQENPVLTSVGTTGYPIEQVQFPAITICAQGSVREIVDAALVKQFREYVESLGKVYSELTDEEIQKYGKSFLNEYYPGAKFPPNQLVRMMSSPTADAEQTMKSEAILSPQPPNNCAATSTSTVTVTSTSTVTVISSSTNTTVTTKVGKRKKRYSPDINAKFCPDPINWWYNGQGSCVHFNPNGKLTNKAANAYCGALCTDCQLFMLEFKYEGQFDGRALTSFKPFGQRLFSTGSIQLQLP